MGANEQKVKSIALVPIGQVAKAILTVIGEGLREAFGRDHLIAAALSHSDYATLTLLAGHSTGVVLSEVIHDANGERGDQAYQGTCQIA